MSILKRDFDISDVLSVTTGALVSTRHMDGIYDIMGYVTGDPGISTIGLAMMADSAKQTILKQHPELADVTFPDIKKVPDDKRGAFITDWLSEQGKRFGKTVSITPTNVPLAMSLEEQTDFVKGINPNIQVISVDVGEPDQPKGRPGGLKPRGKPFG